MTEQEKAEKIAEKVKLQNKAIKDRKESEIKSGFLNPFGEQTTYKEFLSEVKKSKKSVAEYCKDKITDEQLAWLEKDLALVTDNKED